MIIDESRGIEEAIQKIAGTWGKDFAFLVDCEVVSLDEGKRTCIVNSVSGKKNIDNFTARLLTEIEDGDYNIPDVGSVVTVQISVYTTPIVLCTSSLSKKILTIGNQGFEVKDGSFKFNDGKYGGLIKVKDSENSQVGLLIKINNLENLVNNLLNTLKTTTIPLAPSGTYPFAPLYAQFNPLLPVTSESDITNPNITHGKKLK